MALISDSLPLIVGDTVLFICMGYGQPDVQVTWSRNGEAIENTSLVTIYEEEVTQEGRSFQESILELCSVDVSDAGSYTCTVSNEQAAIISTSLLFFSGKKS